MDPNDGLRVLKVLLDPSLVLLIDLTDCCWDERSEEKKSKKNDIKKSFFVTQNIVRYVCVLTITMSYVFMAG